MNCAKANESDLIEYLASLEYHPAKIRNKDYWYLSPLRDERDPSFKVNKLKNIWYDHGIGKGGKVVDFVMQYFNCNLSDALHKISLFHQQDQLRESAGRIHDFKAKDDRLQAVDMSKAAIKIIDANDAITDVSLCQYLQKRRIDIQIANRYCKEVSCSLNDRQYKAIGYKNTALGYELRNEYFKGSSSPKYVTYLDNKAANITVFEGFFDFLTYQSILQDAAQHMTNFLVLNSLSFFERSLLLMEKHDRVHLYLDHDNAGRKCAQMAQQRSLKYRDESRLYKGHKDLNEWRMNSRFCQRKERSLRLRL